MKHKIARIKIISVLLAAVLIFTSFPACSSNNAEKEDNRDSRTVLIYMCGSNLETTFGAATKNIAEMLSVKLPSGVNVMIETGGAKKWRDYDIASDKISRYTIRNGRLVLLQALERSNMGYVKTFSDFLDYGFKKFPAKNTAVILWDHGSGCINGMISDENYSGSLGIDDIKTAFTDTKKKHKDAHVDILGMDACLMANFETAFTLKDCADYILASEEIEPTGGWNYRSLFSALAENKNISAEKLGKAVCDGFCEKYSDSDSNDATLSLIDLSKINEVAVTFNDIIGMLVNKKIQVEDIRKIADSANHSSRCGANSDYTGYSNLIDMPNFAQYYCGLLGNHDFANAVLNCITYSVSTENDMGYGGLSFYYPLNISADGLKEYYDNICPVPAYKAYMKQVFQDIPDNVIEIKDASITNDGKLKVDVTDESLPYILEKEFILYEILEYSGKDGEYPSEKNIEKFKMLGYDNDIITENGGRTYISNFRGVTAALNGVEIYYTFVGKDHDSYFFETPVRVNGKPSYLRFAFVFDESKFNNGYYEIIGVWDGINPTNGMVDKGFRQLKPDDDVDAYILTAGKKASEDDEYMKKVPKSDDGYKITEEPLKGKYYLYMFDLLDIYGKASSVRVSAVFRMTKSPEELKKNPLPDGESAGKIVNMWYS